MSGGNQYPQGPQGYPQQPNQYPPQQGGYPPQQGGYPPQQGGYPPQQQYAQPYGQAYAQQPMPYYGGGPGNLPTDAYGGFWIRFVSYVIDAFVLSIPSFVISAIVFSAMGFSATAAFDFTGRQAMAQDTQFQLANNLSNLVQLLVFWPYYALMHSKYGATVGKMALGLRVVDDTGMYPTFARATGRYFALLVSGCTCMIGFIWAGFHAQKRSLHDLIAGTYVVRKEHARSPEGHVN